MSANTEMLKRAQRWHENESGRIGNQLVNENLETRLIKLEVDLATEIEKIKKYKKHIHDLSQEKKEILFENNSLRKTKLGLENELGRFKTDRQKNDQYCDSLVCECEKLQEENNQLKKENEKLKLEIEKLKKNDTSKQNFEENLELKAEKASLQKNIVEYD